MLCISTVRKGGLFWHVLVTSVSCFSTSLMAELFSVEFSHFKDMDPLNVPYLHFRWVLKHQTSHKCHCSHLVATHLWLKPYPVSNKPAIVMALGPTEQENSFTEVKKQCMDLSWHTLGPSICHPPCLLPCAHAQGVKQYLLSVVCLSVCRLQKIFQISYKQILLRAGHF